MRDVLGAWNEYYSDPSVPNSTFYKREYRSNQTASFGSQHVSRCLFSECTAAQGGGILVDSETKLLIEETSFLSCEATSGKGGGAYFKGEGSCISSRVCSYKCKATSTGQLFYILFTDSLAHKNMMKDCSLSGTDSPGQYSGIYLKYGTILVSSINSSYNICSYHTGFTVYSSSTTTPSDCLISYSCFMHNTMKECICAMLYGKKKHEMRNCNVIKNTH